MVSAAVRLRARLIASALLTLALSVSPVRGQEPAAQGEVAPAAAARTDGQRHDAARPLFRIETTAVENGAELLTVFGSLRGLEGADAADAGDVPLVSVLRDNLGDQNRENDSLRYVWVYTYAAPTFRQRAASGVPFLYAGVGNREHAKADGMPPPVIDLAAPDKDVWRRFVWLALQGAVVAAPRSARSPRPLQTPSAETRADTGRRISFAPSPSSRSTYPRRGPSPSSLP